MHIYTERRKLQLRREGGRRGREREGKEGGREGRGAEDGLLELPQTYAGLY